MHLLNYFLTTVMGRCEIKFVQFKPEIVIVKVPLLSENSTVSTDKRYFLKDMHLISFNGFAAIFIWFQIKTKNLGKNIKLKKINYICL